MGRATTQTRAQNKPDCKEAHPSSCVVTSQPRAAITLRTSRFLPSRSSACSRPEHA